MYQVDDYVVYSAEGVCRVKEIQKMAIPGVEGKRLYYVLEPVNRQGTVYTPVDTKVFMRPVISEEQARSLIEAMPGMRADKDAPTNSSQLRDFYQKHLHNYHCENLVRVIKIAYEKIQEAESKRKKGGETDRHFLRKAEELLYDEFSVAMDLPVEEVKEYIMEQIEQIA